MPNTMRRFSVAISVGQGENWFGDKSRGIRPFIDRFTQDVAGPMNDRARQAGNQEDVVYSIGSGGNSSAFTIDMITSTPRDAINRLREAFSGREITVSEFNSEAGQGGELTELHQAADGIKSPYIAYPL